MQDLGLVRMSKNKKCTVSKTETVLDGKWADQREVLQHIFAQRFNLKNVQFFERFF